VKTPSHSKPLRGKPFDPSQEDSDRPLQGEFSNQCTPVHTIHRLSLSTLDPLLLPFTAFYTPQL